MEVRDECLSDILVGLQEKENLLVRQISGIQEELKLKKKILTSDDVRSKKFMLNVLETRLNRQKKESNRISNLAEKKIKSDPRLLQVLG